jgi:predicted choloylglycine hydrolase
MIILSYDIPFNNEGKLSKPQVARVIELFELFSPGINEEIKGFADAINANVEEVISYYVFLQNTSCTCSHLSLTPKVTDNGHSYLGRNYDYNWHDSPILIESHIKGQYSQIGFGCQFFGRFDGMNS